jgi:hypothetical protein
MVTAARSLKIARAENKSNGAITTNIYIYVLGLKSRTQTHYGYTNSRGRLGCLEGVNIPG